MKVFYGCCFISEFWVKTWKYQASPLKFRLNYWKYQGSPLEFRIKFWKYQASPLEFKINFWKYQGSPLEFIINFWKYQATPLEFTINFWKYLGSLLESRLNYWKYQACPFWLLRQIPTSSPHHPNKSLSKLKNPLSTPPPSNKKSCENKNFSFSEFFAKQKYVKIEKFQTIVSQAKNCNKSLHVLLTTLLCWWWFNLKGIFLFPALSTRIISFPTK